MNDEKKTVAAMIDVYCKAKHKTDDTVCEECALLLEYAHSRLDRCQFGEEKPKCSHCEVHCYKPEMREIIKDVMRFSGPRMAFSHPLTAIKHAIKK